MRAFLLSLVSLVFISGCAQRLDEFEAQLRDLDERARILESNSGMPVGSDRKLLEGQRLADVRSQLAAVINDITVLKGEIEALKFENNAQEERIKKLSQNLQERLEEVQDFARTNENASKSNVQTDYDIALRAHQDGEFEKARKLFDSFLLKYPKHALSDNALYWQGDSYMNEKSYRRAVAKFQDMIERFPRSDKRCDALNHQVTALEALKMTKEAAAFKKVRDNECQS